MVTIKKTAVIPYKIEEMSSIVTDLEKYPEFLSWCQNATITTRDKNKIRASIQGSKFSFHFAFPFIYYLHSPKLMGIHLVGRIFKHIDGFWRFETIEKGGSRLTFELNYEFSNAFLNWTLTPLIKSESGTLIKNFCQRAKNLYGSRNI